MMMTNLIAKRYSEILKPDDDDYLDFFIDLFEKEDETNNKYNKSAINICHDELDINCGNEYVDFFIYLFEKELILKNLLDTINEMDYILNEIYNLKSIYNSVSKCFKETNNLCQN